MTPKDILELQDPYKLTDLEKAYKKAARKYHPDHGGDTEKFKEANEAYEFLKKNFKSEMEVLLEFLTKIVNACTSIDLYHEIKMDVRRNRKQAEASEKAESKLRDEYRKALCRYEQDHNDNVSAIFIQRYKDLIEQSEHKVQNSKQIVETCNRLSELLKDDGVEDVMSKLSPYTPIWIATK